MNKYFMSVKCDPEDPITSAVEERLKLKVKNTYMVYVPSEITSLKRQAFPLSHMAELNTQHRLDADCLCASSIWEESKHDCPLYAWRAEAVPATWTSLEKCLFCYCIMKICQFFHDFTPKASLHCPSQQYQHGIIFIVTDWLHDRFFNLITSCHATFCVLVCSGRLLSIIHRSWIFLITSEHFF